MKTKWILLDLKTSRYVKSTNSGISFTDDIEEAKIYSRMCDVSNSIYYWNHSYFRRKETYNLISKQVKYSVELDDHVLS